MLDDEVELLVNGRRARSGHEAEGARLLTDVDRLQVDLQDEVGSLTEYQRDKLEAIRNAAARMLEHARVLARFVDVLEERSKARDRAADEAIARFEAAIKRGKEAA